ncbi:non-ribosomal peptide synthetase [Smaragdicoccus niigatensis]|uniref:non-ribosomal peptide synthetase n=1 Tax=Smaragdicoccus niigatensis TaxID=359359 RepID=UPI0003722281|nr:non-ribosomal peptide synthetase [Smaragdicoccus niigatensis]
MTDQLDAIAIVGHANIDAVPLSLAQLGMWYAQQLAPHVPFTVAQYVELENPDLEIVAQALEIVSAEIESMRVRIIENEGQPAQVVQPGQIVQLETVDLRDSIDPRAAAQAWMRGDYRRPLDLLQDDLIRAVMIRIDETHWFSYMRVHHITMDGYGATQVVNRMFEVYTTLWHGMQPAPKAFGTVRELYESEASYRDSTRFESDKQYWAKQVARITETTTLSSRTGGPGAISLLASAIYSGADLANIDAAAERVGSSRAGVLIAGFAAYLSHVLDRPDVVVSLPVAARTTALARRSSGMFANIVPLCAHVEPTTTVGGLINAMGTEVIGALRHQRYRQEDIRRDSPIAATGREFFGPRVNVMLFDRELQYGAQSATFNVLMSGGLEDIGVNLYHSDGGDRVHVDFEGNPNLYSQSEIDLHHRRFVDFLGRFVAAAPETPLSSISVLSPEEEHSVLVEWNDTAHPVREATLTALLRESFDTHSDRIALVDDSGVEPVSLMYRDVDSRVSRLARHLIAHGVGPESVVAVAIRRSVDLVVAMNAVLQAGGVYVPVDPDHPAERNEHILRSAQPSCLLVSGTGHGLAADCTMIDVNADLSDTSDAPVRDEDRLASLRPDNTAYIIYTSGSTGRPKGVAVSHRAIVNQQLWMLERYGIDATDVYLQKTAATFDVSMWGYFLPLMVGARIVVAPYDGHRDAEYVSNAMTKHAVTVTDFVPSMLSVWASSANPGRYHTLRHVFVIGEALPVETAARYRRVANAELDNLYGPTEAAVSITRWPATTRDSGSVPIGGPAWNSGVLVLDSHLRPTPIGAAGHLYLSGVQLARGYHGRSDLTADRFVANPYGKPGERMYRTGDLVRWQYRQGENGSMIPALDYLGRTDFQVKFRGQRIELGEIETALLAQSGVQQAAVEVVDGPAGQQLVGYVVLQSGESATEEDLQNAVRRILPGYMVPAAIVMLSAFPLNGSGKLDRKALPRPEFQTVTTEFVAPRTRTEEILAAVYADVLGVGRVGVNDNFFTLGGNSLNGTQVISRAGQELSRDLTIRDLFEAPTVEQFAARVDAMPIHDHGRPPVTRAPRIGRIPLSPAQRRLWFLNQMQPELAAYNMPFAARIKGPFELSVLEVAARDVLERHEALRTIYPDSAAGPHQKILSPDEIVLDLQIVDCTQAEADRQLREMSLAGYDVTRDPIIRTRVFRLSPDEFRFVLVLHHIAGDGWSVAVLAADVLHAYASRLHGREPSWAPLAVQYADFSIWQNNLLGGWRAPSPFAANQLDHWRQALEGAPAELELPTDRPRPARRNGEGAQVKFKLDADVVAALDAVGRQHNVTMFMVLHAVLTVLLSRVTGSNDIPIGTPTAGRGDRALDPLVGMFVNTLVLRTQVDPDRPFTELLGAVKAADLGAFANGDVPLETVVEAVQPVRSSSHQPLFQVMFAFQNVAEVILDVEGLRIEPEPVELSVIKFDIDISLMKETDEQGRARMDASFGYATDIFDRSTAEEMAAAFQRIAYTVAADPSIPVGAIPLVDPASLQAPVQIPQELFPDLLRGGSIRSGDRFISHRELDAWSSRLARELISYGAGPEQFVAVSITRSIESVVSLWAVVKTGAGFVPINPEFPAERIAFILKDTRAKIGLTTSAWRRALPDTQTWLMVDNPATASRRSGAPITDADRVRPLRLDDVAYLIYTSGSTGLPKAVSVTHRGLSELTAEVIKTLQITPDSVVLHAHSPSFDAAMLEMLGTFHAGASLVINPPDIIGGEEMERMLIRNRITHYMTTPAVLATLDPDRLPDLRTAVVGGDACPPALVSRWAPHVNLINSYGPTEATVITAQTGPMVPDLPVTLGKPLPGLQVLLLDERLRPVPTGVRGEVYIAGPGVARGYHNRPDLTSDRFIANPYGAPGDRMYRTGDLASFNHEGELRYYGRTDRQMKIRGQRIEPGEIEAFLSQQPSVDQAVVLPHHDPATGAHLVAYIVPKPNQNGYLAKVKAAAQDTLPRAMVPGAYVEVSEFPITPNGKLDTKALPAPVFTTNLDFSEPQTPLEVALSTVFADVLGIERVGLDDDFFTLGGTSLLTLTLREELVAKAGFQVSTRAIFEASTVRALARHKSVRRAGAVAPEMLEADSVLPSDIIGGHLPRPRKVRNVLLTGATGFLGAHLLSELLSRPGTVIWCLVRAPHDAAAADRVHDVLKARGLWEERFAPRIVAIAADLGKPKFGLSDSDYEHLSYEVDLVFHNGARVNHVESYDTLRGVNVAGTVEILRFATTAKVKPVHYVSTASTVMHSGDTEIAESTTLSSADVPPSGYVSSKWVAEQLILAAATRGIHTAIYRPTLIVGDRATGYTNTSDAFWAMVRAAAELGAAPDSGDAKVSMLPVDYVATAIIELASRGRSARSGTAYHLVNYEPVLVSSVLEALRRNGYDIESADEQALRSRLQTEAVARSRQGDDSLTAAAVLSDATDHDPAITATLLDTNVRRTLGNSLLPPRIDARALDRYIGYLKEIGFLPALEDDEAAAG